MGQAVVYDKKTVNGWAMYDWANSVYSLTITTAIFPIYYLGITNGPDGGEQWINFLGKEFKNVSLYSYALSFSFLVAVIITPLLSGIADYSGKKKRFMQFFCYLGSLACISLFFFDGMNTLTIGILGFVLASIGYTGSIVFYNAYLPEIAPPAMQDRVSAKGFALGYIGSVLLLLVNLAMVMYPSTFGLPNATYASRISFLMVGIWWMGFAQITFRRLPVNVFHKKPKGRYLWHGYRELRSVLRQLGGQRWLALFLVGFFFYSMALQTVMYLAPTFAEQEIKMSDSMLIGLMLIIQIVAIVGAYFFSWLSARLGNLKALLVALLIWSAVVVGVYFIYSVGPFMAMAFAVGFIMGGSQALSRSTYSKLLPETTDHASYFSFYDVMEKMSIVLGAVTYGLVNDFTGSLRNTLFALLGYFIIGMLILFWIQRRADKYTLEKVKPV